MVRAQARSASEEREAQSAPRPTKWEGPERSRPGGGEEPRFTRGDGEGLYPPKNHTPMNKR